MWSTRKALALCSVLGAALAEKAGFSAAPTSTAPTKGGTRMAEHDENGTRNFEASFPLSMPSSFDRNSKRACVALFHNVTGVNADTDNACSGMETACVGVVKERVRNLRLQDGDEPCERLQEDLRDNLDSECREVAGKNNDRWSDLTVKRIEGPGSIQPYSQQANSSSNCWPVPHGDSDPAFVEYRTRTRPGPVVDGMEDVTPILMVFYGGVGSEWPDDEEPRVQMTCVRTQDSSTMAEENESEGGAEIMRLPGMGAALSAAMAVVVLTHISAWA
ncbi:hypothetical protein DL770_009806 [Monosporascus sp. CRB-9-2]|nr:hypothetical protein DL770_009806 [Monosporascus sp. CRB-9-2]